MIFILFILTAYTTKLGGTYTHDEELIKRSFTFKEDNNVGISVFGIDVEGGKNTITYSLFNLSYNWEKIFEKDSKLIFIDETGVCQIINTNLYY